MSQPFVPLIRVRTGTIVRLLALKTKSYCSCRKPQPGMLLQAADDLSIDLQHSWFVGDILDDIEAGNRAGCRTILVDLGTESFPQQALRSPEFVTRDTLHDLHLICS